MSRKATQSRASRSPTTSRSSSTEAGEAITALLSARGVSQYAAAKTSNTSQSYLNQVANGARLPSAGWLETISSALNLSDEERAALHRAAARSHGFKIDLT